MTPVLVKSRAKQGLLTHNRECNGGASVHEDKELTGRVIKDRKQETKGRAEGEVGEVSLI